MKTYDDIVVGSGISGLTLALLLGLNNRRVLLLEKNPAIGGSLRRFYRRGVPLDTGFHFTGGFQKGGILYDMLKVLGVGEHIQPVFLSAEQSRRIVFEQNELVFDMPDGITNISNKLKKYFPEESGAVDRYFEMVRKVCNQTTMDLNKVATSGQSLDEDYLSLEEVLNRLTDNVFLKAVFSLYCMCYGTKPKEVSFANHCRVVFGLYESVAEVKDGGEAFIRAFQARFRELDVEIKRNGFIVECADVQDDCVGRFVLNTGEEIVASRCTFTIHPEEVLKTLPKKHLSRAFMDRVQSFEPSAGFFSVFGVVEEDKSPEDDFKPQIVSLLPDTDLNKLLDPGHAGPTALVIINNRAEAGDQSFKVVTGMEVSFPERVSAWKDSRSGARPQGYREYKEERQKKIVQRINKTCPQYTDTLKILDSASTLTFRDYLNSPCGAAYGIKQKVGQYNLFGKIALKNIYVAGQSSVLPGIVGAMMSSFVVGRNLVGKERYSRFINERLSALS